MLTRSYSYFRERGKWYFRTHDSVMGPFCNKAEAQMAVQYFQLRLKWPSARQLHEFMGSAPPETSRAQA